MLGQPAAAVEPGDRTLADPALGQDDEARQAVGTLDDPGHASRAISPNRFVRLTKSPDESRPFKTKRQGARFDV